MKIHNTALLSPFKLSNICPLVPIQSVYTLSLFHRNNSSSQKFSGCLQILSSPYAAFPHLICLTSKTKPMVNLFYDKRFPVVRNAWIQANRG
ncbi:hypothetical protein VNO78_21212 [Psophocarpus tetragonolobus]|uniref:Uncharacterized protein n=1 Tax=Psophocarpus tetragonolobus TaxID=3891 RepID=A0AAN9SCW1_PSOTE